MNAIWNWLHANSQTISTIANVGMVVIWVVYLQLALSTYIKQRRPQIIVDQAYGHGVRSVFMLINLSQVPIHISCILVAFNVGKKEEVYEITDFEHSGVDPESGSSGGWEETLKHGPVQAGGFLVLGSVPEDLLSVHTPLPQTRGSDGDNGNGDNGDGGNQQQRSLEDQFNAYASDVDNFEIRVIGVFSMENRPVGARRRYRIETDDKSVPRILPEVDQTEQLTSRWDRSTLREWLRECRDQ